MITVCELSLNFDSLIFCTAHRIYNALLSISQCPRLLVIFLISSLFVCIWDVTLYELITQNEQIELGVFFRLPRAKITQAGFFFFFLWLSCECKQVWISRDKERLATDMNVQCAVYNPFTAFRSSFLAKIRNKTGWVTGVGLRNEIVETSYQLDWCSWGWGLVL